METSPSFNLTKQIGDVIIIRGSLDSYKKGTKLIKEL
jgi:hypothetical protein